MRWIEAAPGAKMLGFESCILMKQMEPDAWLPGGIGEVAESERETTLQYAPRGTGRGHVCGTEKEFAEGGTLDESIPLALYTTSGLPRCCDPPRMVRGGAGVSGRAQLEVVPVVTPGLTCEDAGAIALNTTYALTYPGGSVAQWFRVPPVPGGFYHVTMTADEGTLNLWLVWGAVCGLFGTSQFNGPMSTGCGSMDQQDSIAQPLFVRIGGILPAQPVGDYTFKIEAGLCP